MFGNDRSAGLAEALLAFRRSRVDALPSELFGEPAWDILLELFVADAKGHKITGLDIAERADTSIEVVARWLRYLTKKRLVVGEGEGNLSDHLGLSGSGMDGVERILLEARAIGIALVDTRSEK